MKNIKIFFALLFVAALALLWACNSQPKQNQQSESETESSQDLEQQSEDFNKSMDEIDESMDIATDLNKNIQLIEQKYKNGEISRERADVLIQSLNTMYGQKIDSTAVSPEFYTFPQWLQDIGITEPQGLTFDGANSFQTNESKLQDGYNSVVFIYNGDYEVAMKESERIANAAGIPMSKNYRKARELSEKMGKKFEGLNGVTYMNYEFGDSEFSDQYRISINVTANGKLTLNVVDIKAKSEWKKTISPNDD